MRIARVNHLGLIAALLVGVLIGRLLQMQVLEARSWQKEAQLSRTDTRTIPYRRGRILDRDGLVLAEDRITLELHCNYREFRRGHVAGQLLAGLGLISVEVDDGLPKILAEAEDYADQLLRLRPEQLAGLAADDAKDLRFYLRVLAALPRSASTSVQDWASEGSVSFEQAFPDSREIVMQRIRAARHASARLDDVLLSSATERQRSEPPWLVKLEERRQELEVTIRRQAVNLALDRAIAEASGTDVRAELEPLTETGAEYLQILRDRWRIEGDDADFIATLRVGQETSGEYDSAREDLLLQIGRASAADVAGLRRDLVGSVHSNRTKKLRGAIDYEVADLVVQGAQDFPGLFIQQIPDRVYPVESSPHLVGRLSKSWTETERQVYDKTRDRLRELGRKFYLDAEEQARFDLLQHEFFALSRHPGERSGLSGVEARFDEVLRGQGGYLRQLQGAIDGSRPRELDFQPPIDGDDVVLFLDVGLQRAAEEALKTAYRNSRAALDPQDKRYIDDPARLAAVRASLDLPRAGFVLLDLRDGSVPVLATLPTYTHDEFRTGYQRLRDDNRTLGQPLRHRGLGGGYDANQAPYPGSTFKLLTAIAALQDDGSVFLRTYHCGGELQVGEGSPLHCEGTHGDLQLGEALMRSCNIYFYKLAEDLGYEKIYRAAKSLGFGAPTGLELVRIKVDEDGEFVPESGQDEWIEGHDLVGPERHVTKGTMLFGIGQSKVIASPLQMARFYAWLATGELPTPRLVREGGGARTAAPPSTAPALSDAHRLRLLGAMRTVVEHPAGTAYDGTYPLEDFDVVGKTGTAQVSVGLNHSWFAGYFPYDAPRYAFAVFCENADLHGGEIASDALYQFLYSVAADELYGDGEGDAVAR